MKKIKKQITIEKYLCTNGKEYNDAEKCIKEDIKHLCGSNAAGQVGLNRIFKHIEQFYSLLTEYMKVKQLHAPTESTQLQTANNNTAFDSFIEIGKKLKNKCIDSGCTNCKDKGKCKQLLYFNPKRIFKM